MHQLLSIFELSCILCLVSLAAILTFRFAGFPDLSVDGVFTLGSVVFAQCLLHQIDVPLSIVICLIAGSIAGFSTASISAKLRINPLLASVLMLTILYSLNLRILGGANRPFYDVNPTAQEIYSGCSLVMPMAIAIVAVVGLYLLFRTEFGCALRCTGRSSSFLNSVGRNAALYKILLVSFAGALVAVSGSLLTLKYGFSDVSLGSGTIIVGIASLIIGEKICGRKRLLAQMASAPVGILLYELAVGVALSAGVSATDVKLATGAIAIGLLALGRNEKDRLFAENN